MPNNNQPSLPELFQDPPPQAPLERRKRRRRHKRGFRWFRHLKRRIRKINWRVILAVGLGSVSILVMTALVLTINARNNLYDSWDSLSRVWDRLNDTPGTELTLTDFNRLQVSVNDLSNNLSSARRQMSFLRPFGFLNGDLETSLEALDAGQELALAAQNMLRGMQPALFFLTEGEEDEAVATQLSSGERVVELLSLGRGSFLSAQIHLDKAKAQIARFNLGDVSGDLLVTVDGLDKYQDQLENINQTLLDSPNLLTVALGLGDARTYLILSQNSDELRPSGGYISTYGWMTVRNGRITDYDYNPTTATSPNPPPESLAGEVEVPSWWIRYHKPIYAAWDGSWYPDFPSTARMAAWFYNNGNNLHAPVDGVIAVDLVAVEYILDALQEVEVPEFAEFADTVTPANFRDVVYAVRAEGQPDLLHKTYVAALYRQILTDWQSLDADKSVDLRGALLRALQEKHAMVYFTNESLNEALDTLGWLGAQGSGLGQDYLMAVDANLGNKSNHSIVRQITYDVEIQTDGTLICQTAVSYDYPARLAEEDPAVQPAHYGGSIDYNNLLQLFVPANSTLTGSNNIVTEPTTVASEGHTAFVAFVQVKYDQSERFQFSYTTPPLVESFGPYRRYTLRLEKQPGMVRELVNVQVRLPQGARTVEISPPADASYQLEQPILEFRVDLTTNQTIEIIYTE